jgi:hypothetical protein
MCDGHIMYQGEAKESASYFKQVGIPCPKYANPSDFYMKVMTVDYPKTLSDEKKVAFLALKYEQILASKIQQESKFALPPIDSATIVKYHAPFGL